MFYEFWQALQLSKLNRAIEGDCVNGKGTVAAPLSYVKICLKLSIA